MIDRSIFYANWRDGRVDMIHVNLHPGVDPQSARELLRGRLKGRVPALLSTREEFLTEVRNVLDRFNTLTRVAVLMGLLVAYMGIVTSLLISVAERAREIGILRAVGALGSQIRRSVVFEAVATTACATAIALPLAALLARFLETTVMETYAGFRLSSAVPAGMLTQLSVALPIISILAAWIPARHAAATNAAEALSYD
jgi:putative ABC transport system permease protein